MLWGVVGCGVGSCGNNQLPFRRLATPCSWPFQINFPYIPTVLSIFQHALDATLFLGVYSFQRHQYRVYRHFFPVTSQVYAKRGSNRGRRKIACASHCNLNTLLELLGIQSIRLFLPHEVRHTKTPLEVGTISLEIVHWEFWASSLRPRQLVRVTMLIVARSKSSWLTLWRPKRWKKAQKVAGQAAWSAPWTE